MLNRYKTDDSYYSMDNVFLRNYRECLSYKKLSKKEQMDFIKKTKLSFYDDVSDSEKQLFINYYREMFPNFEEEHGNLNDEKVLDMAIENSKQWRDKFIENNQRLVLKIALGHVKKCYFLTLMELINEGNLGMIEALKRFDVESGNMFSTYAEFWIKQCMGNARIKTDKTIRVSAQMNRDLKSLYNLEGELYDILNRRPTLKELANYSGFTLDYVNRLADYFINKLKLQSLEKPIDDGSGDLIGDYVESGDEDFTIQLHNKMILEDIFNSLDGELSSLQMEILKKHYGFDDGFPYSYEDIAKQLDMETAKVKKINNNSIKTLRKKVRYRGKIPM